MPSGRLARRTCHVSEASDLLPLLLQVSNLLVVILKGQVLKPAAGGVGVCILVSV
jgi:hypothetical protein